MTINILKVQDSSISVLKSIDINDGINLLTGYNVLNVEYDGSKTSIAIGNKELRYIAEFEDICYSPNSQYGLLVGPAAKLAVERIVFKHSPITAKLLETGWTMQSLNEYFKKSNDALEGFWTFFDKSLIPRHHVGDKGFDLLGCDRQTALLKQRFEPCCQVGFGRIAFKIGQEILAQAGKIGSRVLRRIVVVAGKQRIDKRFYLFVCGVEFKRSDQRVPVKV